VLQQAPWRFGGWHGQISGSLDTDRQLHVRARALAPSRQAIRLRPIEARLDGRWSHGSILTDQLELVSGTARLGARGVIGPRLALEGWWQLQPQQFLQAGNPPDWLGTGAISGGFQLRGPLGAPELALRGARQASHPLLGPWYADVNWRAGVLHLERFEAGPLQARASLPLALGRQGLTLGPVKAWIDLRDLPLSSLDPLVGTSLHGRLNARGWLRGPLKAPVPDLALTLRDPGAGPLQLREGWHGQLQGEERGGARLQLDADGDALPGRLAAWLTPHWRPTRLRMERDGGLLELAGDPRQFRWTARHLPLHGLELLVGGAHPPQPVEGRLGGVGELGLQPLGFRGRVTLEEPGLFGLGGRLLTADVHYADRRYHLTGSLQPLSPGSIEGELDGRWQGPFQARLQARGLSSLLAQQLSDAWEQWRGRRRPGSSLGSAADLGSQAIATVGLALEQQIQVLDQVRERLGVWEMRQQQRDRAARLAALQMRLDADLTLAGPSLRQLRADLDARGHLWLSAKDRDLALARDPFQVRLQGPLSGGGGRFSLSGLTLALLSLLTPVPESLRGYLNATGRYRLGRGRPQLTLELSLDQAQLGERALSLERGGLSLGPQGLTLDLALKPQGSSGSIDLTGLLPLDPGSEDLRLRLASRGDGLIFLSELAGPGLRWRGGHVDLQLLMRGSLRDPIANGFLRIRDGSTDLVGLSLRQVQATILFDFQQLLLQELHGRVGQRGEISGEGKLGLVRELGAEPTLSVKLSQVPFRQARINAVADGNLELGGSLLAPQLGGAVRISQGTINVNPAGIAPLEQDRGAPPGRTPGSGHGAPGEVHSANDLLQRRWNFREPLQLLGPTLDSGTARSLEAAIPRLSWLQFSDLRLVFGPNLRMVLPAIANFTTGGALRLNGHLDPTLRASGVVRLLKGRLNLFTTTFSLDPDTPNVAVFTPSQGLVPYLDIALRSRVADNRNQPLSPSLSSGETTALPVLTEKDSQAGFTNLNQLNLILVTVSVSGPADELAQNIRLRSSPPLSQERLLALIGGNSLAGLQGGEAGTALATALGQSLLSPLLGSLTDALGERVSLALYPTYVNQAISDRAATSGERIAPQLVLAAEVGYDLTRRLNASLLAAPNRSDVPPQLNLNYKASPNLSLEGSVDTEGSWQTQLQLFLRF
jgi:translocation and assembly module TamB